MAMTSQEREIDNREFDELLETSTKTELLDERQRIVDKLNTVKADVALAKRRARASNYRDAADPQWLTRAEGFVRLMGARVMRIQNRLGEMNAEAKDKNIAVANVKAVTDASVFVEQAKRLLDRETYLSIWDAVDRVRQREQKAG